jgi:hypothetical protein
MHEYASAVQWEARNDPRAINVGFGSDKYF